MHGKLSLRSTYSNVLRALDAQQVTQVLNDLLTRVGAMRREGEHARPGGGAVEEEGQGMWHWMARRCVAP